MGRLTQTRRADCGAPEHSASEGANGRCQCSAQISHEWACEQEGINSTRTCRVCACKAARRTSYRLLLPVEYLATPTTIIEFPPPSPHSHDHHGILNTLTSKYDPPPTLSLEQ